MQFDLTELQDSVVLDSIQRLADITFAEYLELITPLLVYLAGMTVYALFVFSFYRYLARRDLVKLRRVHYFRGVVGILEKAGHVIFNFIENIVIAPVLVFFWFGFMATVLLLLSKRYTAESVMLISAALVGVVRITSYYTEELSQDVGKMIPFALLGIFIVDMSYFDWQASLEVARQLPAFWGILIYYLAFIVALEVALRTFRTIFRILIPEHRES
jgi:FtsH-binding integral membrane protein